MFHTFRMSEGERQRGREEEGERVVERGRGRASEAHKNSINTLMKHMAGTLAELPPHTQTHTHAETLYSHQHTHSHLLSLIHTRLQRIRLVKFCTFRAHFLSCCAPVTFACMPSVCVCVRVCLCVCECVYRCVCKSI